MLEAPVGLALFGSDLRFRWVNAALVRVLSRTGPKPRCARCWPRACR
jgi:hypothetical protein